MPGDVIQIGPFIGGLNTDSDPTSVADNELVECENFELDLDGSLVSRPPFQDSNIPFPLKASGNVKTLGYYYDDGGVAYLLASDGLSSTYYFTGGAWTLITDTFAATAMTQFNKQAWMLAPVGSTNPGGYWSPAGGFTAEPNMPRGDVIVSMKLRLWVAIGKNAPTNGTRLFFSKVLGQPNFWSVAPDFIEIGGGDGQNIVNMSIYYQNLLIFRTSSIYSFQFTTDPTNGTVNLVVPGVGLASREALVAYENYFYFMDGSHAYEFINNRASQINVKVPFVARSQVGIYEPYSVSVFNQRILFTYWDTTYVYSLKTRSWSIWSSSVRGPIGKMIENEWANQHPEAVAFSNRTIPAIATTTNLATNPGFEAAGAAVTVSTNLATNPSFEAAGAAVTVRTNLATNPDVATDLGGWLSGKALTRQLINGKQWVVVPTGTYTYASASATAGKYYSLSMRVRGPVGAGIYLISTDNAVGDFASGYGVIPAGGEMVLTATASTTAKGGSLNFGLSTDVAGLFVTEAFIEEVSGVGKPPGTYFSANTPAGGDFTYAWTGAANASASVQRGVYPAGMSGGFFATTIQSSEWASKPGGKSLRIIATGDSTQTRTIVGPGYFTVAPGEKVTVLGKIRLSAPLVGAQEHSRKFAAYSPVANVLQYSPAVPNEAGVHELRWIVTAPAGDTSIDIRVYLGTASGGGDMWVDDLLIVKGEYAGPYYDGSTSPEGDFTYAWSGVANASTSLKRAIPVGGWTTTGGALAIQSSEWKKSGSKSVRIVSKGAGYDSSVALATPPLPGIVGKTFTMTATSRLAAPQATVPNINQRALMMVCLAPSGGVTYRSVQAPNAAGEIEHRLVGKIPADATYVSFRAYNGAAEGQGDVWWDEFLLVEGTYDGKYFDGSTPSTNDFAYAWTGAAHASTSTVTTIRNARTLSIRDGLTSDTEAMKHSIRTKNYNYEASAAYKRLFWWGVDAAFRSRVVGEAVPITYNYAVTWAALRGKTWAELLTWRQPISDGLQVVVTRDTVGTGAQRKFTKFPRGLRFRQIYFRLVFDSDGSSTSSPVRIFSLTTVVKSKQRVSKEIT